MPDNGHIVAAITCWGCALLFWLVALWAFLRKSPMHFWSGSKVEPHEIADIPAYNKANGVMWAVYGCTMLVSGIVSLFSTEAGVVLLVFICGPGIVVLIKTYRHIYNKYSSKQRTD
jgi:uncharacterized membrane-anchored protein